MDNLAISYPVRPRGEGGITYLLNANAYHRYKLINLVYIIAFALLYFFGYVMLEVRRNWAIPEYAFYLSMFTIHAIRRTLLLKTARCGLPIHGADADAALATAEKPAPAFKPFFAIYVVLGFIISAVGALAIVVMSGIGLAARANPPLSVVFTFMLALIGSVHFFKKLKNAI